MVTDAIRDQLERVPRADELILQKTKNLERLLAASVEKTKWIFVVRWLGLSVGDVARRASQILLRDHHVSLLRFAARKEADLLRNGRFVLGDRTLVVEAGQEGFVVSSTVWCRGLFQLVINLTYFFALSVYCALLGQFRQSHSKSRLKLFFGSGLESYFREDEKVEGFRAYCERGRVECLRLSGFTMLVQAPIGRLGHRVESQDQVVLTRDPLRQAAFEVKWNLRTLIVYALVALRFGVLGLFLFIRFPWTTVFARDLGRMPFVRTLEQSGLLESVILTNSAFNDQELWMNAGITRGLQSHMLWYSTNTRQFRYRDSRYFCDHPSMSYLKVDHAWVWNAAYADWVRKTMSVGSIHVCGPILYRLQGDAEKGAATRFDILIFDVTPVGETWFAQNYITDFYYYYQTANVRQFVEDILSYRRGGETLRIAIKHKRGHQQIHESSYVAFIKECEMNGIEVIDPREDVFALIRSSRVSIAMPFSAPANAAAALGFPAIYHDPTGMLLPAEEVEPGVVMTQSRSELHNEISRALAQREELSC